MSEQRKSTVTFTAAFLDCRKITKNFPGAFVLQLAMKTVKNGEKCDNSDSKATDENRTGLLRAGD